MALAEIITRNQVELTMNLMHDFRITACESARETYKQHVHPRLSLVTAVDALCLKVLT
jgi:hypothetical protein